MLVLVTGLHLAMLASWRFTALHTPPQIEQRIGELVFLAQSSPLQLKEKPRHDLAAARSTRRSRAASPVPAAPTTPAAPVAGETPPVEQPVPDLFAQPAPVAESVLERSRHAAIGIDRQLRKESKNDNDRVLVHESKLSQDMALAYKGSGAFSMTETVLPNGDSLARVTTPLGSYCMLKRGNRDHAGLNAVNNAGKTLIVRCPK